MNLRKLARGQECQVNIFGVCNHNPETTTLAHLNGGGMATKKHDLQGAWACSACHAWLDGGYVKTHYRWQRDLAHREAVERTQNKLCAIFLDDAIQAWKRVNLIW